MKYMPCEEGLGEGDLAGIITATPRRKKITTGRLLDGLSFMAARQGYDKVVRTLYKQEQILGRLTPYDMAKRKSARLCSKSCLGLQGD